MLLDHLQYSLMESVPLLHDTEVPQPVSSTVRAKLRGIYALLTVGWLLGQSGAIF